jgi:integrase
MSVHPILRGGRPWRYEVRWREGNRQRSRRFKLRRDADAWDLEVTRRKQLGSIAVQHLTARGPTLNDWIEQHWAPEHAVSLAESTRDRYAIAYEIHVEPWLGHLSLQDLTVGRLREWQAGRLAAGVTEKNIMKARTLLSSVLRHAAESEAIQANPLTLVRPPKLPHKDAVIPLSPRQVERLRRLLRPRDATIVAVLAYSGVRPSELRALRWGDIGENTILVERAANPNGTIKGAKTKRGRRNVRLLAPLAEDLKAWRALTGGRGRQLVFPITGGDPVTGALTRDAWNDWRSHIWIPTRGQVVDFNPRPYDLRHSFASLLLAEGRTVHYVAEQLGHDASQTLSTYGHLIAEYADSHNIDAETEIRTARDSAQAWSPPTALPAERGLGANQQRVLHAVANAGIHGATFTHGNDQRAATSLIRRGLLAGDPAGRYTLTDRGKTIATHLSTDTFGLGKDPQ